MPAVLHIKKSSLKLLTKVLLLALGILLIAPGLTWSSYKQFMPKFVGFDANLSIRALYEDDQTENSSRSESTFQEGIGLNGYGYIYSPLFISMATTLGFGLEQTKTEFNDDSYTDHGYLTQFKQEFKILPNHDANAELYFKRTTPMTYGQPSFNGSTVIYEQGALFRYLKRPWSSSLTLINHESDTDTIPGSRSNDSDFQSIGYNFIYFAEGTNIYGSYSHNDSALFGDDHETTTETFNLGFSHDIDRFLFSGRWNKDTMDENIFSFEEGTLKSYQDREEFFTAVHIDLPSNFDTTLNYTKTEQSSRNLFSDVTLSDITNDTERYTFNLRHHLFKSLTTSFRASHQLIEASSGESTMDNYSGNMSYNKKIPWGTILAGLMKGRSYIDNTGAPVSLFENHTLTVSGPGLGHIDLTYQTIDESTITVQLVDSANNNRLVRLVENIDYRIDPHNNSFRIVIISWPPVNDLTLVGAPEDYTYQVNYAFIASDYELQTDNWSGNLSLPLFNNLLTPHYSYSENDQSVLDGTYPGEPSSSKAHTYGLSFNMSPFSGDISQSHLRSTTLSEDRLTTYVSYVKAITPFTSGDITLSYENIDSTDFDQDPSNAPIDTSEEFYTAQAQIATYLEEENLNTSIATSYSFYKGVGESTDWSLFSSLTWHVGLLDLDISINYTNSESTFGGTTSTYDHTVVKFMLKRELF